MMDPIRIKLHGSIDLLACAICACVFKGETFIVCIWLSVVHLVMCEVAIVLQSKSIKLFRGVVTGPNLSLTTDHMSKLGTIFVCVHIRKYSKLLKQSKSISIILTSFW